MIDLPSCNVSYLLVIYAYICIRQVCQERPDMSVPQQHIVKPCGEASFCELAN